MKIVFELSKEHATLPRAEVFACLHAENVWHDIVEANDDALVIETAAKDAVIKKVAARLSLTFFTDKMLFSCQPALKEIKQYATQNTLGKPGSVAIQYKNRSNTIDSQPILKTLGEAYTKNRTVDLATPDILIRALITDSTVYVGLAIAEINRRQFETRKVQHRPFFSPISLHPKLARALANLSMIRNNETLLDPFCGTGGILLEAGLLGAKVIGSDIEEKMIEGCTRTLDFYKINNYEVLCSDIGDIKQNVDKVDAVVTDLPYGKATTTKGENISHLCERAFEHISDVLKKGRRAVMGLPKEDMISGGEHYFSLVEQHDVRVHRSLTRYFAVYQK